METINLPNEVQDAYFLVRPEKARTLNGGIINTTILVESPGAEKTILQRLHSDLDPVQLEDYQVISQHLMSEGWDIPGLIPTLDGKLHVADRDGNNWRAFEFMPSDTHYDRPDKQGTYGRLLGKLHKSLGKLAYTPQFSIPNFHNTEHYALVLEETIPNFTNKGIASLAGMAMRKYENMPVLPEVPGQIIHADPKTANILLRNREPFTFIDWDTAMHGPPWIDIGDMLRSVISQNEKRLPNHRPLTGVFDIIEAYRREMYPKTGVSEFSRISLRAAGNIMLELAMRYLADYKDGDEGYFAWDETQYRSRHAHNSCRAATIMMQLENLKPLT